MRRPVDVKAHFHFLLSVNLFHFSQAAPVAILPFALFVFSRCCYLIIDLSSYLLGGSWAPGPSRSHLDSAVKLSCLD
jgi:hypothetical protein